MDTCAPARREPQPRAYLVLVDQVLLPTSFEPLLKFLAISCWQGYVTVLVPLGSPNDDSVLIELHFLYAQPQQFVHPHPRP